MIEALNAWSEHDGRVYYAARDADGRVRVHDAGRVVYSYLRGDSDPELIREIERSRVLRAVERAGDWWRLHWSAPWARDAACGPDGWFASKRVPTFEADLPAVRQWAIERDVQVQRPRLCYFDIETDARAGIANKERMRILCWTVQSADGERVQSGMLEADTDAAERDLLRALWREFDRYDQVAAWYGDGFDFPVVFARSKRAGISVDARRWLWLDHLEVFRRMNISSSESGEEKQSLALQAIAMAVLGEGKLPGFGYAEIYRAWAAGGDDRDRLLAYNVRDVDLMRRVEDRTGYIELLFTLCATTGVFPDTRGIRPMPQVETYVQRLANARGDRLPTQYRGGDESKYRGAYVMEPRRTGLIRDRVHVCDFGSMYPSIVQTWNISPEMIVEKPPEPVFPAYLSHLAAEWKPPPRPAEYAEAPKTRVWFRQAERGLLPRALDALGALRAQWQARKAELPPNTPEWRDADARATAYKINANSFPGVIGASVSRLYSREAAESVSTTGAWLLEQVDRAAREHAGLDPFYGDTDSSMVAGCSDETFAAFVAWCNGDLLPRLAREQGCAGACTLKLAYEKAFERMLLLSAKRYIARLAHYKGQAPTAATKPEIKGIEYKRGDSLRLTRQMQAIVIDLMMGGGLVRPRQERCEDAEETYVALVEAWRDLVLTGPLELADVVRSQRLTQPLKAYAGKVKLDGTESGGMPHVRVARVLAERGEAIGVGARVEYVVVDGSVSPAEVIPASDWTGECDRFALWESAVWPPTRRLLESAFPAGPWARYDRVRPSKRRPAAHADKLPLFEAPTRRAKAPARPAAPMPQAAPESAPTGLPGGQIGLFGAATAARRGRRRG